MINDKEVALDDCVVNLNNGDYTVHLNGNQLDIALLTDQPIKGAPLFYTTITGNAQQKGCVVSGFYRIENIKNRNFPLSSISGRIATSEEEGVHLEENYWHIFGKNIPIHCHFEKNAIKIDWGMELDALKDMFKESVQNASEAVDGFLNKIKNKFK